MILQITPEQKNWAYKITDMDEPKIFSNPNLKSRFNTNWRENYALGMLGEILFREYLIKIEQTHKWLHTSGTADNGDFEINGTKFDIKTNLRKQPIENLTDNYQLMLLESQIGLHADFYVWILVQGKDLKSAKFAKIMGFMRASRTQGYPSVQKIPGIPAKRIPIADVLPIEEMRNVI